jgi:membrane-bound serine protease (ClpP class)
MSTNELVLALLTFGIIFMLAEIIIYTFGVLAISGTVLYLAGITLILMSGQDYYFHDWVIIVLVFIGCLAMVFVGVKLAIKSFHQKVVTGKEGLFHETGTVVRTFEWIDSVGNRKGYYKGKVLIHGEVWEAESQSALKEGELVTVTQVHKLVLQVKERG